MSGRIRLLQMMAGAHQGGAELFFERLAVALAPELDQCLLIRDNPEREARLPQPVGTARFGGALDLATRRRVAATIAGFEPDIVMTWMSRATQFCPRGPFVHLARLGGYYPLKHYRHCDHLIGNTPDLVDYFRREGWPEARTHYIPNFVDDRIEDRAATRAHYGVPDGAAVIAALGRLHENKAFDILIRALADVPRAVLLIAGDGPLRLTLMRMAEELGVGKRVRFLGWQKNSAAVFGAADVIAVPSRHEPLGNVVLEAWAKKRPVVAAASQGPRFLIEHGKTGLLSEIDNAQELAASLRAVLEDGALATRLVDAGAARFRSEFDEASVVHRYMSLFREVLKERKS